MGSNKAESIQRQQFEIGDEVLGDECIQGTIIGTRDLCEGLKVFGHTVREYVVKSETGERLVYAGELNLRLVKKGLGDAAPPSHELLKELDDDLRNRPLAGIRW